MTGTTTGETSLVTATGSDVLRDFVKTSLTADLQAIVDLFNHTTGHDHSGAGKGAPISTLTAPVVGSGGLQVQAGNVGIGQGPASNVGISQAGTITAALGAVESQSMANTLVASAANDSLTGLVVQNTYNPNAQTGVTSRGINVGAVTGAAVANYGIDVQTPSGATTNIGVRLRGGVPALQVDAGGIVVAGGGLVLGDATPAAGTGQVAFGKTNNLTTFVRSTGVGTINFSDATSRANSGWLMVKAEGGIYYAPLFVAN